MKNLKVLVAYQIFSPLQLLNFLSFYNQNKTIYSKAVVFIDENVCNTIDKSYINLCNELKVEIQSNKINFFDFEKGIFDVVFVSRVHFYFWPMFYQNKNIYFDKIILINDGISNYCNNSHVIKATLREGDCMAVVRFFTTFFLNKILYGFNKGKIIEYNIFNKDTLEINEKYKNSFIQILRSVNRNNKKFKKGIVFCGQPLVELGLMTEEKYIKEIIFMKNRINEMGYELYVKKHPKENLIEYEKYNISIIDFKGVVEELFLNNNFYAVISNCSTSSLLIPALFNVKSYIYSTKNFEKSGFLINQLFSKYCHTIDQLVLEKE